MAERENLFRRLTRLFRSGPVVKNKIKSASSAAEIPASSMIDHLKTQNYLYSNSVSSCYDFYTIFWLFTFQNIFSFHRRFFSHFSIRFSIIKCGARRFY